MLAAIAANGLELFLDAAPGLVLGLAAAGVLHAWLPVGVLGRWLGGAGVRPVLLAAFIGAPLPLCSCGVLPAAVALRRAGASPGAVTAFLIATPETGVDSIALSYGILGPFFAIARPIIAIASAVFTGLLMRLVGGAAIGFKAAGVPTPACATNRSHRGGCCGGSGGTDASVAASASFPPNVASVGAVQRTVAGLGYAFTALFDDLAVWLAVGLVAAAVTATLVPPHALVGWGSGLPAMLTVMALGVPMYICATASTPLAGALLLAGVSPGTVMVFLLTGPATNLSTLAVVRRELGGTASVVYVVGLMVSSLGAGLLTDMMFTDGVGVSLTASATAPWGATAETVPLWLATVSGAVLVGASVAALWRRVR